MHLYWQKLTIVKVFSPQFYFILVVKGIWYTIFIQNKTIHKKRVFSKNTHIAENGFIKRVRHSFTNIKIIKQIVRVFRHKINFRITCGNLTKSDFPPPLFCHFLAITNNSQKLSFLYFDFTNSKFSVAKVTQELALFIRTSVWH